MSSLNLYAVTVMIWGSTWLAIKYQLGIVPPAVSVVWRFGLSAAILLGYAKWKRLNLRFSPRDHFWIALVGLSMFGINYIAVYISEIYLASGLVAVIFSLIAIFNIVLMRVFYATPISGAQLSLPYRPSAKGGNSSHSPRLVKATMTASIQYCERVASRAR